MLTRSIPRFALVLILSLLPGCQKESSATSNTVPVASNTTASLRPLHEALFDTMLPPVCLRDNPQWQTQAIALRTESWSIFSADPTFAPALQKFNSISGDFIGSSVWQRGATLVRLQSDADPVTSRLVQGIRTQYLALIYSSPLGFAIAGLQPAPPVASNAVAIAQSLAHRLPVSQLVYDPHSGAISLPNRQIDYLIIGSGPAGAVLAHELRRGGHSVVLLDRGPLLAPGAADGRVLSWLFESLGRRASVDGGLWFNNGQAVGGGTAVNIDLAFAPTLPTIRYRIDQWRTQGRIAPDQFQPQTIADAYRWVRHSIGTRTISLAEINPNNRILWDGGQKMGLAPKLYELNTFRPNQSPWPATDKRSAVDSLILPAMLDANNPLQLLPDAKALRLLFDPNSSPGRDRHATGIEIEIQQPTDQPGIIQNPGGLKIRPGTIAHISAQTVILCAGTLGSASLLLSSNIDNPNIGAGLVVHPSMPIIGVFDHPINALDGTPSSVYIDDFAIHPGYMLESMSALPVYVAAMIPGDGQHVFDTLHNFSHLGGFGVMLIDPPHNQNRILLDSTGHPQIDYRLADSDKARFRSAIAEAVRIIFNGGARQVILPSIENVLVANQPAPRTGLVLTDVSQADLIEKNLNFIPGRTIVTSAHLQASTKMGSTAKDSVVSPDFRLWGTSNVYVVGSSVFPTSIGANPMQSIYTFAKIFADKLNQPAHK